MNIKSIVYLVVIEENQKEKKNHVDENSKHFFI